MHRFFVILAALLVFVAGGVAWSSAREAMPESNVLGTPCPSLVTDKGTPGSIGPGVETDFGTPELAPSTPGVDLDVEDVGTPELDFDLSPVATPDLVLEGCPGFE